MDEPRSNEDHARHARRDGSAAEKARVRSIRRFAVSGFLLGAVAGGLFGFQAVVTEGWATGLWFVAGIGLPAGVAGALLAMPLGMLRGRAVRNRLARRT